MVDSWEEGTQALSHEDVTRESRQAQEGLLLDPSQHNQRRGQRTRQGLIFLTTQALSCPEPAFRLSYCPSSDAVNCETGISHHHVSA